MINIDSTDREDPVNETTVYRLEDDKGGKTGAAVVSLRILQQLAVVEPTEGS